MRTRMLQPFFLTTSSHARLHVGYKRRIPTTNHFLTYARARSTVTVGAVVVPCPLCLLACSSCACLCLRCGCCVGARFQPPTSASKGQGAPSLATDELSLKQQPYHFGADIFACHGQYASVMANRPDMHAFPRNRRLRYSQLHGSSSRPMVSSI
jgi:hypothetical protein